MNLKTRAGDLRSHREMNAWKSHSGTKTFAGVLQKHNQTIKSKREMVYWKKTSCTEVSRSNKSPKGNCRFGRLRLNNAAVHAEISRESNGIWSLTHVLLSKSYASLPV